MDPAALASLCLLIARAPHPGMPSAPQSCPPHAAASTEILLHRLGPHPGLQTASDEARDAIARVSLAEAGNQGDSGLAAVIYTILNRLADGRWGNTVDAVLNARGQFEPVLRAGGDWRLLPTVSPPARARVETILNLALDGRLPDPTLGARYFQNPAVVAMRARSGEVSSAMVNFGGQTPVATIGAHSFYVLGPRGLKHIRTRRGEDPIFVGPIHGEEARLSTRQGEEPGPGERGGEGEGQTPHPPTPRTLAPPFDPIFIRPAPRTPASTGP